MLSLSHSAVQQFIEEAGYKLLSTYKNGHTKIQTLCPREHLYPVTFHSFKQGARCRTCSIEEHAEQQKYIFSEVKQYIEEKKYIVLSIEYKGCESKLQLLCPNQHECLISWSCFRQGIRCKRCFIDRHATNKRLEINKIRKYIEDNDFRLLSTLYKNNSSKLHLQCKKGGHDCYISWGNFSQGTRCRKCSYIKRHNLQRYEIDYIIKSITDADYEVVSGLEERQDSTSKFWIRCKENHMIETCWNYWQRGHRCLKCQSGSSKAEQEIKTLYLSLSLVERDRTIIKPYELDLYFLTQKVAIEYCGLYWHSEYFLGDQIKTDYHRNKLDLCTKQNIRLLTIFEDEWKEHKDICISRINSALAIVKNKIFARECIVKQVSKEEAREFLERTHLQGAAGCKVAYGLFSSDKLVQVMTFGALSRAHTSKGKRVLEMKRLAGELDTIIVGGASKLFKLGLQYAKDNKYEIIKSYCDLRWGTGNLYQKLGFIKIIDGKPAYDYTDGVKRWRGQRLAQNKKKTGTTEKEIAKLKGLYKIYDCGQQTWEYKV